MAPTAYEIQKERIAKIEAEANELLDRCDTLSLASVNEQGYPRICTVSKFKAESFREMYFISSKRSKTNGKITHFESNDKASVCYTSGNDSVTLIGKIEFVTDRALAETLWRESDRHFFAKGVDDPKFRLLRFRTIEATFWINGSFRTCKYK